MTEIWPVRYSTLIPRWHEGGEDVVRKRREMHHTVHHSWLNPAPLSLFECQSMSAEEIAKFDLACMVSNSSTGRALGSQVWFNPWHHMYQNGALAPLFLSFNLIFLSLPPS